MEKGRRMAQKKKGIKTQMKRSLSAEGPMGGGKGCDTGSISALPGEPPSGHHPERPSS